MGELAFEGWFQDVPPNEINVGVTSAHEKGRQMTKEKRISWPNKPSFRGRRLPSLR